MLKAVAGASDRWRVLLSDSSTAGRAHRTRQVVAVCVGTRAVVAELRASLLAVAGDWLRTASATRPPDAAWLLSPADGNAESARAADGKVAEAQARIHEAPYDRAG